MFGNQGDGTLVMISPQLLWLLHISAECLTLNKRGSSASRL